MMCNCVNFNALRFDLFETHTYRHKKEKQREKEDGKKEEREREIWQEHIIQNTHNQISHTLTLQFHMRLPVNSIVHIYI